MCNNDTDTAKEIRDLMVPNMRCFDQPLKSVNKKHTHEQNFNFINIYIYIHTHILLYI